MPRVVLLEGRSGQTPMQLSLRRRLVRHQRAVRQRPRFARGRYVAARVRGACRHAGHARSTTGQRSSGPSAPAPAGQQSLRSVIERVLDAVAGQQPAALWSTSNPCPADRVDDQHLATLARQFRAPVVEHAPVLVAGLRGEADDHRAGARPSPRRPVRPGCPGCGQLDRSSVPPATLLDLAVGDAPPAGSRPPRRPSPPRPCPAASRSSAAASCSAVVTCTQFDPGRGGQPDRVGGHQGHLGAARGGERAMA